MALKILTITTEILYDDDNYDAESLWEEATDLMLGGLTRLEDFEFILVQDFGGTGDLREYVEGEYDEHGWTVEDYESWKAQKYFDEVNEQEYEGYLNPEAEEEETEGYGLRFFQVDESGEYLDQYIGTYAEPISKED